MTPLTQAIPQGDGADGPFTGPTVVMTGAAGPAFNPPAEHVIKYRDAEVTALVEPMARMLYKAMQAQHLGSLDGVEFDDLSVGAKAKLVSDARVALHLQSPLYRSEAERQVKLTFTEALTNTAFHYPHLNPVTDLRREEERRQAMVHVVRALEMVDMPTLLSVAHRMALTSPLPLGAQKQVTLTALRGMFLEGRA